MSLNGANLNAGTQALIAQLVAEQVEKKMDELRKQAETAQDDQNCAQLCDGGGDVGPDQLQVCLNCDGGISLELCSVTEGCQTVCPDEDDPACKCCPRCRGYKPNPEGPGYLVPHSDLGCKDVRKIILQDACVNGCYFGPNNTVAADFAEKIVALTHDPGIDRGAVKEELAAEIQEKILDAEEKSHGSCLLCLSDNQQCRGVEHIQTRAQERGAKALNLFQKTMIDVDKQEVGKRQTLVGGRVPMTPNESWATRAVALLDDTTCGVFINTAVPYDKNCIHKEHFNVKYDVTMPRDFQCTREPVPSLEFVPRSVKAAADTQREKRKDIIKDCFLSDDMKTLHHALEARHAKIKEERTNASAASHAFLLHAPDQVLPFDNWKSMNWPYEMFNRSRSAALNPVPIDPEERDIYWKRMAQHIDLDESLFPGYAACGSCDSAEATTVGCKKCELSKDKGIACVPGLETTTTIGFMHAAVAVGNKQSLPPHVTLATLPTRSSMNTFILQARFAMVMLCESQKLAKKQQSDNGSDSAAYAGFSGAFSEKEDDICGALLTDPHHAMNLIIERWKNVNDKNSIAQRFQKEPPEPTYIEKRLLDYCFGEESAFIVQGELTEKSALGVFRIVVESACGNDILAPNPSATDGLGNWFNRVLGAGKCAQCTPANTEELRPISIMPQYSMCSERPSDNDTQSHRSGMCRLLDVFKYTSRVHWTHRSNNSKHDNTPVDHTRSWRMLYFREWCSTTRHLMNLVGSVDMRDITDHHCFLGTDGNGVSFLYRNGDTIPTPNPPVYWAKLKDLHRMVTMQREDLKDNAAMNDEDGKYAIIIPMTDMTAELLRRQKLFAWGGKLPIRAMHANSGLSFLMNFAPGVLMTYALEFVIESAVMANKNNGDDGTDTDPKLAYSGVFRPGDEGTRKKEQWRRLRNAERKEVAELKKKLQEACADRQNGAAHIAKRGGNTEQKDETTQKKNADVEIKETVENAFALLERWTGTHKKGMHEPCVFKDDNNQDNPLSTWVVIEHAQYTSCESRPLKPHNDNTSGSEIRQRLHPHVADFIEMCLYLNEFMSPLVNLTDFVVHCDKPLTEPLTVLLSTSILAPCAKANASRRREHDMPIFDSQEAGETAPTAK